MSRIISKPESTSIHSKIKELESENSKLRSRLNSTETTRLKLGELTERLNVIQRLCQRLNTFDITRISKIITRELPELIGAKYCSLYLYDYFNCDFVLQDHNHTEDLTSRIPVKNPPTTIMEFALLKKEVLHVIDIDEFQNSNPSLQRNFKSKYATKSLISTPLIIGGEKSRYVVGVLNFADKIDGGFFDEVNDVATVRQIGQFLALAIKNCRLFNEVQQQARQDSLTHLANYRGFHETLLSEIHRTLRYKRTLSVLMFDLDNFKQINDTLGHQAGDFVLRELGKLVKRAVRREDLPARYGGDELVVILPETGLEGALLLATRIKEMITLHNFVFNGKPIKINVSCGVAQHKLSQSISDFVGAVDNALYKAKQNGKNKIVVAE